MLVPGPGGTRACGPSTLEAEARECCVQGQSGLHGEMARHYVWEERQEEDEEGEEEKEKEEEEKMRGKERKKALFS